MAYLHSRVCNTFLKQNKERQGISSITKLFYKHTDWQIFLKTVFSKDLKTDNFLMINYNREQQ